MRNVRSQRLVERAEDFAKSVHAGMKRVETGGTYEQYLARVAELIEISRGDEAEIAAAWLHKTVALKEITIEKIKTDFGIPVGRIVEGITDPPEFEFYSTLVRKHEQAKRLLDQPVSVRKVKIAAATASLESLSRRLPPSWSRTKRVKYIRGTRLIAEACGGDSLTLDAYFGAAYKAVEEYL